VRRDAERLSDILEAAGKIAVRVARGRQRFDADEDTQIVLVHLLQVTSVEVLGRYADAVGGRLRVVIDFGDELIAV
jgi:hypothetical protein